jgi:DNA-binding MarR family transcriptional regulator
MAERSHGSPPSSLSRLDPVVHAPARLNLLTQLYVVEAADATFLVKQTGLSWGNFATHINRLEDSGYVAVQKSFRGKKPLTMIRLTPRGRKAFREYRANIQQALADLPD